MTQHLNHLFKQIQSTFTQNNQTLKKALKKSERDGRIRDMVQQRSNSNSLNNTLRNPAPKRRGRRPRARTGSKKRRKRAGSNSRQRHIYQGPLAVLDEIDAENERHVRSRFRNTKGRLQEYEQILKDDGFRIYPDESEFSQTMKRPLNDLSNHRATVKSILREEFERPGEDTEFYSPHKDGPVIINHAANNPVTSNERRMRNNLLSSMNS